MNEIKDYIQIIVWVITVASLYWKVKNDIAATQLLIKAANERIDEIEKSRAIKWGKYDIDQTKQNDKLTEIAIGVAKISKDMEWVKNK